ncbi:cytochrome P450 [Crocosphaera chwakensis CCY0110]|uniref:Cytochrome P450 n=1 Tax=Crocosphaera chwakensis CCY0110 TaxID=391612 RepID=A3IZ13_9CHRO|nr:cytochrome P450 [Crocosphaera chwakensis CCY0110]
MLFGNSSISVQVGEIHKQRRQILYEVFKPRMLDSYFNTMVKITEKYLDYWMKQENIVWYPEIENYTFDLAFKFLIGLDKASESSFKPLYEQWQKGIFSLNTIKLPWTKFGKAWKARNLLKKELKEIIIKRQKEQEANDSDALDILIKAKDEDGKQLLVDEISDHLLNILFAGYGTLTSTLASFCRLMAQEGEILGKIREEQQRFPKQLTIMQLKEMPYLDLVLKELLRTNTPVGTGFRQTINNCEINGYHIPKNWFIFYQISNTHKDTDIYQDPDVFDPDRFGLDRAEGEKPFSYLPFGGGIRECLGKDFARLEMKIFSSLLVRKCQWDLLPNQNLEIEFTPVAKPKDGLKVKISSY